MSAQVVHANPPFRRHVGWLLSAVVAEVAWLIFLVWMAWQA